MSQLLPPFPPAQPMPHTEAPSVVAGRPPVVTAVGVMSLVVALLGVAGAVVTSLAAFAFYAGAHAAGERAMREAAVKRSAPRAPDPPVVPVEVGPDGLAGRDRAAAVEALEALRPLAPKRVEQLDAILARHGRSILLAAADRKAGLRPDSARVRELVEDHGELFSGNRAAAPQYFKLATGRLELYDDRAVFYPADGTPTLRSSLTRLAAPAGPRHEQPPPPAPQASTAALVTVVAASALGAALSVLLLVAAIQTLRGAPSGRVLHLVWASAKVPVSLAGAAALWWLIGRFYESMSSYAAANELASFDPARMRLRPWHPLLAGAAALCYPVAVLWLARRREMREYLRQGG